MGQLGFPELIVIFIIALLVFGPKKLPELGKSLGKGLREFKRATEDLKQSWDEQLRDAEHISNDVKDTFNETANDLKDTERDVNAETHDEESSKPAEPAVPKE